MELQSGDVTGVGQGQQLWWENPIRGFRCPAAGFSEEESERVHCVTGVEAMEGVQAGEGLDLHSTLCSASHAPPQTGPLPELGDRARERIPMLASCPQPRPPAPKPYPGQAGQEARAGGQESPLPHPTLVNAHTHTHRVSK